jgi:hypothetical protein
MSSRGLLFIGAALLGGGALLASKRSNASSSSSDSGTPPAWTPGPANEGRIYGTLPVDLDSSFWPSNGMFIDPQGGCAWIVEGDRFLPVGDAIEYPAAFVIQFKDLGASKSAWHYVKKLIEVDKLTAAQAAAQLFQGAANYYVEMMAAAGQSVPTPACLANPSPAVAAWLTDTTARIQSWIDGRLPSVGLSSTSRGTPLRVELSRFVVRDDDGGGLR